MLSSKRLERTERTEMMKKLVQEVVVSVVRQGKPKDLKKGTDTFYTSTTADVFVG